jgi:aspartate/methionine/tyrosine aminotransferase
MSLGAIPPFALERFFAQHEFTAKHLLCCSDCEPLRVRDLADAAAAAAGRGATAAANAADTTSTTTDALLASTRLSYTETRGDPELRAAIAQHVYADTKPPLDPHHELLTCVPQEGILLATAALALKPGDLAVATKPGYQSLHANAESCGANVLAWRPRLVSGEGGGRSRLAFDAADLERLLRPSIDAWGKASSSTPPPPLLRAVFVNFICHNPTGFLGTDDLWRSVRALLREASAAQRRGSAVLGLDPPPPIMLFSDEMYAKMEAWRDDASASSPSRPQIATALDLYEENDDNNDSGVAIVALCGLSKSWGCPGLRLGWLASRHHALLDRAAEIKDYTTICSPGVVERLALAAVEATASLTRLNRARATANARRAAAFFGRRWSHLFDWPGAPDAGPICFPAARPELLTLAGVRDVGGLCDRLVAESGVLLLPATVYSCGDQEGGEDKEAVLLAGRFRLGLGRDERLFEEGLGALDGWLKEKLGARPAADDGREEGAGGGGGRV